MSHTFAARCTICGALDDKRCPECGTSSAVTHGIADQRPWRHVADDGYVHEWHPECCQTHKTGPRSDEQPERDHRDHRPEESL